MKISQNSFINSALMSVEPNYYFDDPPFDYSVNQKTAHMTPILYSCKISACECILESISLQDDFGTIWLIHLLTN